MRSLLYLLAVVLGGIPGYAQTIRLAVEEGYIMTSTRDARKAGAFKPDRTYHWVRAQQLFSTQGGASGDVLHGPFLAYHPNGQLKEAGRFKEGIKQGEWRSWNERGELVRITRWRQGKERAVKSAPGERIKAQRQRNERVKRPTQERIRPAEKPTRAPKAAKAKSTERKERKPERGR